MKPLITAIICCTLISCSNIPPRGYLGEWLYANSSHPLVLFISSMATSKEERRQTVTCTTEGDIMECKLPTEWEE